MSLRDAITPEDIEAARQLPVRGSKTDHLPKWQPGQSGNPKGRPKGAKSKLAESFLREIQQDFEIYGRSVIEKAREADPVAYLKIIAGLLPKDYELKPGEELKELFELVASGGIRVIEEGGKRYLESPVIEGEATELLK